VKKMIAGPNAQICDGCVDICLSITSEEGNDEQISARDSNPLRGASSTLSNAVLRCALCRIETLAGSLLYVPERGAICFGCVEAIEAVLAERPDPR
jgi:hypothetical protein